jgi:hypothetical protein
MINRRVGMASDFKVMRSDLNFHLNGVVFDFGISILLRQ